MDINQLLKGFACECGKTHSCPIEAVYIEKGAIEKLGRLCEKTERVLLVADENTFSAAGEKTLAALSGKKVTKVIFTGKTILVPDEVAIEEVQKHLGENEVIVGIGSGVIQDLCKYVSHFSGVPYMVVATAPSMDGYASNGAAMITGGMKVTYAAGLPLAILADTEVLKDAPMEMIRAGFGDIVGKYSALNDWKLSHLVNGEYLCPYIYNTTYEQIQTTLSLADGLVKRDEKSVGALMEALVVVGIMMSFAGSSRPASGSEHHLSHFFEITGILEGSDYFSHGIDVAYSTVITAGVREKLLQNAFPAERFVMPRAEYEAVMAKVYKTSAEGCIALQDKVGNYALDRMSIFKEKEDQIRAILSEMPSAKTIEEYLALVGLDMKEFYALYGEEKIQNAVLYAKDLKDRYTVLWMNYEFFGV